MAASRNPDYSYKVALQSKLAVTSNLSVYDLETTYFSAKLRSGDAIRSWLQGKTGITTGAYSINDLWRAYFITKGVVARPSLGDMAREYFDNQVLP